MKSPTKTMLFEIIFLCAAVFILGTQIGYLAGGEHQKYYTDSCYETLHTSFTTTDLCGQTVKMCNNSLKELIKLVNHKTVSALSDEATAGYHATTDYDASSIDGYDDDAVIKLPKESK